MSSVPHPKDIFGRPLNIGDYIAAGMNYGQSSVLRIGEVINIKQSSSYGTPNPNKFSIRVRWRNNGDTTDRQWKRYEVKDSTILWQANYSYAKFVILDKAFVNVYPADILDEDDA